MAPTRRIEIFSAGCPVCEETIAAIRAAACPSCDIEVHDMQNPATAAAARVLGVTSLPAVAINGRLADCCAGRGPDLDWLRSAGLGRPIA